MILFDCSLARGRFQLDASFEAAGGVLALFGPSGSGKSTILNLFAGTDRPDRGRISIDDVMLVDTDNGIFVPPHKRRIGFVFQSGQLFPHLSVRKNLQYGKAYIPVGIKPLISFEAAVDLLGLGDVLESVPATLSGGEAQRVAIGRALLSSPRALLMDEPLASLDEERKNEILPFIERLAREVALPIIYVSHSPEEVARLATTVCRLSNGRIERQGAPSDVLRPRSLAEEDHLGGLSILRGTVAVHDSANAMTTVAHPAGDIEVPGLNGVIGQSIEIVVRPSNVALALATSSRLSIRTSLRGKIAAVELGRGPYALASVELVGGTLLSAYLTRKSASEMALRPGQPILCLIKSVSIADPKTGKTRQNRS